MNDYWLLPRENVQLSFRSNWSPRVTTIIKSNEMHLIGKLGLIIHAEGKKAHEKSLKRVRETCKYIVDEKYISPLIYWSLPYMYIDRK